MLDADEVLVVLTTWPDVEKARSAGRTLVEEKLAACANLVPAIESIYRWQGAVEESTETLMMLKTTRGRYAALESRIKELHSYEVPEVLTLSVAGGSPAYIQWVKEN